MVFFGRPYASRIYDIAILANAPAQAETLLHTLERAAAGIGLQVNAHKKNTCALIKQVIFPH